METFGHVLRKETGSDFNFSSDLVPKSYLKNLNLTYDFEAKLHLFLHENQLYLFS